MPCRLFKAAVEDQLHRLKAEKDEKDKQKLQLSETAADDIKDSAELTLIRWGGCRREAAMTTWERKIMYLCCWAGV